MLKDAIDILKEQKGIDTYYEVIDFLQRGDRKYAGV
ncbi:hypothetical protein IGI39_000374 [Enterococcus sp. AZ135]